MVELIGQHMDRLSGLGRAFIMKHCEGESLETIGATLSMNVGSCYLPVRRVTDSASTVLLTNTFNVRSMRTTQSDIAAGNWTYTPNALGEITDQFDAKLQHTSFEYDALGRMTKRIEPEGQSDWTWGSSAGAKNIGQLALMTGPGYAEAYEYDNLGRLAHTTIASDATYHINYSYNALGAIDTLTYPTSTSGYRLKLQYDYQNGYLLGVKDYNVPSTVFWTANDTDARGSIISESLGNGVQTIRGYDTVTGQLDYLQSGIGGAAQDLNYSWDRVGNLIQREDVRQGITETFAYDDLHRLTTTTGPDQLSISYDSRGNVTFMSGGGVKSGMAHTINWFSYNLPQLVTGSAGNSSEFFYGPDRSRWKQVAQYSGSTETTVYIGGLIEKVTVGTETSWKHTIAGASGPVAIYIRKSTGANAIHYVTKDHLGSVDSISNASGGVHTRLSFGSFGGRRNALGWSGEPTTTDWNGIEDTTRHGFTGHEMLDNLNLVHMNGRVYDPQAARFISPDPFIDGAEHTQGWNRYAYVKNNPLSFTDPTGFKCNTTCIPTEPWKRHAEGLPLGDAGVRSYVFDTEEDPVNPDRPGLETLATDSVIRAANQQAVAQYEHDREVLRNRLFDRSAFTNEFNQANGYDTGARDHLYLPSAPARSTAGRNPSALMTGLRSNVNGLAESAVDYWIEQDAWYSPVMGTFAMSMTAEYDIQTVTSLASGGVGSLFMKTGLVLRPLANFGRTALIRSRYWETFGPAGGRFGRSLHHWLLRDSSRWAGALRNGNWNLVELPGLVRTPFGGLNQWMGLSRSPWARATEWAIRIGILSAPAGGAYLGGQIGVAMHEDE